MTEEQKRNIRECLKSQGMDPDLVKRTMWHIEREEVAKLIRDTIDKAHSINPEELNVGPDTTENINEISEEGNDVNLLKNIFHEVDAVRVPSDIPGERKYVPVEELANFAKARKDSEEDPTQGDWQPGVKFPAGAVEKGLVDPGLKYYEATGRKPETPIEKYYVGEHMKRLKPEEKEHYKKLFTGTEKEDPTQDVMLYRDVMWYFDPESEQFKPVIEYETEGLHPGTEKKINIKDYCDKMSNKKHTACPDPVFTDECVWYALNRDDNQPHSPVPSLKNITPGQWDKMTEDKITEEMITNARDTTNPFTYSQILTRMHKTHERKNHDYGDAAYQGYKKFGPTYFLVQLHNKLSRLESLTAPGTEIQVKDESIDDTLLDLANYAVMYLESRHRND